MKPSRALACFATSAAILGMAAGTATAVPRADKYPHNTPVSVQLLSITDFHSGDPLDWQKPGLVVTKGGQSITPGGPAYLKTHLDQLRAQNPNTVTFSNGDNFTAYNYTDKGSNYEWGLDRYNHLGMEFTAVGNHDIDWNIDYLMKHYSADACSGVGVDDCFATADGSTFAGVPGPSISANMTWKDSGELVYQPYVVKEFHSQTGKPVKVGIIGATIPGAETWPMSFNEKLSIGDPLPAINKYADELSADGVNAIVVSLHNGGYSSTQPAIDRCGEVTGPAARIASEASPKVDAIIAGDTHKSFNCPVKDPAGNTRFFAEGGSYGSLINQLNLTIRPSDDEVLRDQSSNNLIPNTTDVTPDPEMLKIDDYWTSFMAQRSASTVAFTKGAITRDRDASGEHQVGNLAADGELWSAAQEASTKADFAIVDTSGSDDWDATTHDAIYPVASADAPAGLKAITHETAFGTFGRDMKLVTVSLRGSDVTAALEQQWTADGAFNPLAVSAGVHYSFDASAPVGSRVRSVTIDGKPLDPTATYRVAMSSEDLVNGQRHGFKALMRGTDPTSHMQLDNKTFVSYLRSLGTVVAPELNRVDVIG